ncbi:hypothetical protein EOM86_11655 [Candidatus Nomurabacteria bacterium]|nr:hypothetical protein [Candidatus Nomurabacteria bacterium]
MQRIIDVGHPYGIKQSVLAERYGVSQSQISLDMKEIQLFLKDTLGDYAVSLTQIAFEKIYNKNMQSENYEVAWKVLMDWNKWLENRGALNQEPKTIKVEHRLKDMSKDELLEMLDGIIEEDED